MNTNCPATSNKKGDPSVALQLVEKVFFDKLGRYSLQNTC